MNKALNGLLRIKSLKDKYLSLLTVAALLLVSSFADAQYDSTRYVQPVQSYGSQFNYVKAGTLVIGLDTTHLAVKDSGAIAFKGGSFYGYNGYLWSSLGSGSFTSSTLDSLYSLINSKVDTTGYSTMWQPLGVYDIGYNQINDSVRLHFYSDGSTRLDTVPNLRTFSQSTYTSLVTFLNYYDSLKGRDTTKIVSIVLNGTDTTLKIHPNPNNRNDTLFFHMDSVDATHDGYATTYIWRLATGALQNYVQNGRIYGGVVTWLHDYVYNVSEAYYYIDGILYHSPSTDITLAAADATNDRFDLFVLTTSNTAIAITGTAAATPVEPDYDANTQLQISFALVSANTTQPIGTSNTWIYKENAGTPTEWTAASAYGTINPNSTTNPDTGTKDVEGTNVATSQYITFTAPAGTTFGQYNTLVFRIRSKANFGSGKKIVFRPFVAANTATGNNIAFGSGSYGFVSSNTSTYQTISIPISDFGNSSNATILRITQSNTSGTGNWLIDNIQLQNTQGITNTANLVSDVTKNVAGDSFYIWKNNVIVSRLKDASGAAAFDSTSLSNRIDLKVNISDTASMLNNYLRKIDTTNKWVQSLAKNATGDSFIYYKNGVRTALKDSIGLTNITGLLTAGSGVSLSGSGTVASPYSISSTGVAVTNVYNEAFTGSTSTTLTLSHAYTSGTIRVSKNGVRLKAADFTEATSTTITLNLARLSYDEFTIDFNY